MSTIYTGVLDAVEAGASFTAFHLGKQPDRPLAIFIEGNGVQTIQLERKCPTSGAWVPFYVGTTQIFVWSYTGTPFTVDMDAIVDGIEYRLNCTAWTSGSATWTVAI